MPRSVQAGKARRFAQYRLTSMKIRQGRMLVKTAGVKTRPSRSVAVCIRRSTAMLPVREQLAPAGRTKIAA
jgi:hypothetical protein